MKNILAKAAWLVMGAPAVYLAFAWNRLPDTIAMHYDLHGNPDRYGNKKELIGIAAILIAMNIFVYFLLTNIYRIDPKKRAGENKDRLHRMAFAVVVFISALLILIIYSSMQGKIALSMGVVFSGVGLLFAVMGNYMPNLKPNYFAGFRLPWTLENEDNWKKTHIVAGKLWFFGGLLLAIVCLFTPPIASIVIFFAVTLVMVIVPFVVSYRMYKQQKTAGSGDGSSAAVKP